MKNKNNILNALGLSLSLVALPLLSMMTGCASERETTTTETTTVTTRTEDQDITTRVRNALADDSRHKNFVDINVETNDGAVLLTGWVNTQDQKNRAGSIARNVRGVRSVHNDLTVRGGGS